MPKYTEKYIKGRIKSWDIIIRNAPTKKLEREARGCQNFWKDMLRKRRG